MSTPARPDPNKNVPPNWKPVAALDERKPGMLWSDRLYHLLVCLGGLAVMGVGAACIAYLRLGRIGGAICAVGFVLFALGFPSEAQRRGYRE